MRLGVVFPQTEIGTDPVAIRDFVQAVEGLKFGQHRERLNLSGWVVPLLGRYGMVRTPRGNREGFLIGLRHLYHRLRGYTIWLYVDRAVWYRGEE